MPLLSSSSFRNAARNAISGAAMLGLSGFGSYSVAIPGASLAHAEIAIPNSPACVGLKGAAHTKCEIKLLDNRIKTANNQIRKGDAEIAAANADGEAAEVVSGCVRFLTGKVKDGTIAKDEILKKAEGKLSDQNACKIAKGYGYGRAVDRGAPVVN